LTVIGEHFHAAEAIQTENRCGNAIEQIPVASPEQSAGIFHQTLFQYLRVGMSRSFVVRPATADRRLKHQLRDQY
jgi:hypothetical protein